MAVYISLICRSDVKLLQLAVMCLQTYLCPDGLKSTELAEDCVEKNFIKGANVYRMVRSGKLDWSQESLSMNESWPSSEQPSFDQ